VICRDGTVSFSWLKLEQFFAHFHAVTWGIDCLACQGEFFVNNLLDVKENYENAVGFTLQLSRHFRSRWVTTFRIGIMPPSPNACLIIARVTVSLFPKFVQNLMLFLCRIRSVIASGQMNDSKGKYVKNQYLYTAAWMFVHWLPRYDNTIIYLSSATTTGVQIAVSFQGIMDNSS
jgi:hypothetical protein